ncbi:putative chromate transport protein [Rubrobacter xylanophilus DSM 9941]|uniref:chromate efflux transporter n=1 Tax=Rubrobacter xylanophilus TaxID=49319 RepID=UPI001C64459E|nr:chromate efflux transporter [Rubrobacter xylanophilus]QYJ15741.1 putative chromate transport protein [Rubrobacter xylanophilus DSM 9941]
MSRDKRSTGRELRELALLFTKLGFVAFGGPAAHIAMMRDEVVVRRGWMGEQQFLDLVGATNLIPGPNSTELAIHIGRLQAGWRGLVVAGSCFILPAALMVLVLAILYARYGSTPAGESLMYGISPVIIAIILQALWGLGRTAIKDLTTGAVGAGALVLYLLAGIGEIPLLLCGGFVVLAAREAQRRRGLAAIVPLGALVVQSPAAGGVGSIFLSFLKIGSVLFGSGYVLLAFLRSEFVGPGLLSERQLIDAVAIGQFTPGPVFTTATFIGYLLEGLPGAAAATAGIFLPAFVFVALTGPFIPRLRRSPVLSGLLDGVNVVSLALMAGVSWELGRAAVVDPATALLALLALALLVRFRVNSAWLVLGGGACGLALQLL